MTQAADLTGLRVGRLTALRRDGSIGRRAAWIFRCDCGVELRRPGVWVARAVRPILSCGCQKTDSSRRTFTTHGLSRSSTYNRYRTMLQRCTKPTYRQFKDYGGRGISVCDRWLESFENFLEDMGEAPDLHTLERRDNDGGYSPDNCLWLPYWRQSANRRSVILVETEEGPLPLKVYASRQGVDYSSLHYRVRYRGQRPEAAAQAIRLCRRLKVPSIV